jgi:hypothetical protein
MDSLIHANEIGKTPMMAYTAQNEKEEREEVYRIKLAS